MSTNQPEEGKVYQLTGGSNDKCIVNGNTWEESVILPENKRTLTGCDQCGRISDGLMFFSKYKICATCTRKNHKKATTKK